MANTELLKLTRAFLAAQPEKHKQDEWFAGLVSSPKTGRALVEDTSICGSVGCVAGWGSLIAGYHQVAERWQETKTDWTDGYPQAVRDDNGEPVLEGFEYGTMYVVDETATVYQMMDAAIIAMELTYFQWKALFNGSNSREQVFEMLDALIEDGDADILDMSALTEGEKEWLRRDIRNGYSYTPEPTYRVDEHGINYNI